MKYTKLFVLVLLVVIPASLVPLAIALRPGLKEVTLIATTNSKPLISG